MANNIREQKLWQAPMINIVTVYPDHVICGITLQRVKKTCSVSSAIVILQKPHILVRIYFIIIDRTLWNLAFNNWT